MPDLIDPFEFVEKKRRIKGLVALSELDRMRDSIVNPEGTAAVELEFKRESSYAVIFGKVEADLVLVCQCCLENLNWHVSSEVSLGIVGSIDEANLLPDSLEPLMIEAEGRIALADIIQDELLLAIPPIPQHPSCKVSTGQVAEKTRRRPFAALEQLKKNQSQE